MTERLWRDEPICTECAVLMHKCNRCGQEALCMNCPADGDGCRYCNHCGAVSFDETERELSPGEQSAMLYGPSPPQNTT